MSETIDMDDFSIGELEEIEEITGSTIDELFKGGMSAKALKAVVFVARRRNDPDFTLEDAAKVRMSEIELTTETDPTDADG